MRPLPYVVAVLSSISGMSMVPCESVYAQAARPPMKPSPYGAIYDCYERGKPAEARTLLLEYVRRSAAAANAIDSQERVDVASRLGIGIAAQHVANCLEWETKRGTLGNSVPTELTEAAKLVMSAVDAALAHAEATGINHEQVLRVVRYAQEKKAAVILAGVRAWRSVGQEEAARALADQHAAFLKTMHTSVDGLLAQAVPVPKPVLKETVVLQGPSLAVLQLLVRYYDALAAEDVAALDRCLYKSDTTMDGKDMVAMAALWRKSREGFEGFGPAHFDADTELTLVPRGQQECEVICSGLQKSIRMGGKLILSRESDSFVVRVVDGVYKLAIERGKREKGE